MNNTKILLVSDTHGFHENFREAVLREAPFARVLHMGDTEGWDPVIKDIAGVPVDFVSGNCDWASDLPSEKTVTIDDLHIFMTHGHEYYVTTGMEVLLEAVAACGCRVALFGHTHRPFLQEHEGVLVANPGSISRPRQADHRPSYAVLTIDENHVPAIEIKFLEK